MAKTYEERVAARRANLRKMYMAVKSAKEVHGFVRYSKYDEIRVKLQKTEVLRILRKKMADPSGGVIADRLNKWQDVHGIFFFMG